MKFDLIIMNPPYQRDLHLKILEESLKHLKSDNSKNLCVNLSPSVKATSIRNLYDEKTINKHKKFKILKNLKEVELIKNSSVLLQADIQQNLGLQVYSSFSLDLNSQNDVDLEKFVETDIPKYLVKKIMQKCLKNSLLNSPRLNDIYNKNIYLKISGIHGHPGNRDFYDILSPDYNQQLQSIGSYIIYFNSEEDRKDFYTFWVSTLGRFLISLWKVDLHVYFKYIPDIWCKNDEEFVKYFNITDNEFEQIKSILYKYE